MREGALDADGALPHGRATDTRQIWKVKTMNNTIEQAITQLRANAERYAKTERYYNGDHDLKFASQKFQNTFGTLFREFALNLCPVICDAVRDKLRVTGFSVEDTGFRAALPPDVRKSSAFPGGSLSDLGGSGSGGGAAGSEDGSDGKPEAFRSSSGTAAMARHIWQRNRMGTRAGEIHKEALKNGDAYMIVWPNERGEAVFYPNKAANITVETDEAAPGRILWAAKAWRTLDKYIRLNIYYADRIEKYVSKQEVEGTLPGPKEFVPFVANERTTPSARSHHPDLRSPLLGQEGSSGHPSFVRRGAFGGEAAVVRNPFGVVPVFHFANNADIGMAGRSELEAAIPVQDGLNKSVLDMLVAMEFSAYRQRWAAGIEIEYDEDGKPKPPFKAGIDHVWISNNPGAHFGDFEASQLDQFLKVKDSFRVDMASVTGTPLHYFLQQTGGFPSGESLKKAETRFLAKVRDRQESFGQVWSDAMAFALMIEGQGRAVRLITEWEDPAPMAEREFLENILLKKQIGLPVEQALLEAGYGAADVKAMVKRSGVE